MVEILHDTTNCMLSLYQLRVGVISTDFTFAFGSCKEEKGKRMLLYKQKKAPKGSRLLVSITILGSAGPIRFVADAGESIESVIETALKSYAREGRLPVVGSDLNEFFLYCLNVGFGDVIIGGSMSKHYVDTMVGRRL